MAKGDVARFLAQFDAGYAAGVADTEAKYAKLVEAAKGNSHGGRPGIPCGPSCTCPIAQALRELEATP